MSATGPTHPDHDAPGLAGAATTTTATGPTHHDDSVPGWPTPSPTTTATGPTHQDHSVPGWPAPSPTTTATGPTHQDHSVPGLASAVTNHHRNRGGGGGVGYWLIRVQVVQPLVLKTPPGVMAASSWPLEMSLVMVLVEAPSAELARSQ